MTSGIDMRGRHKTYIPHRPELAELRGRLQRLIDLVRFLEKVSDPTPSGCWEWRGSIVHRGRGPSSLSTSFRWNGRSVSAYRAAYELFREPIPNGVAICHRCDNRLCVNPWHLFPGSQERNMTDKMLKGRASRKLTEDQVRSIRSDTRLQREIAADFGINQPMVSAIKRRAAWAWLE